MKKRYLCLLCPLGAEQTFPTIQVLLDHAAATHGLTVEQARTITHSGRGIYTLPTGSAFVDLKEDERQS